MTVIRSKKDRQNPYVQISRKMLDDSNISLKTKGFISYCLSKKDDWTFYVEQLASVLKEKKSAIYSAIKEAISNGYCIKHQPRDEKGRVLSFEYIICDSKEELQRLREELKICLPEPEKLKADKKPSFSDSQNCKKTDLKKCLPLTDFPLADNPLADNQQLTKNDNNKNNNNNIVCCSPPGADEPLKNSVVIFHFDSTTSSLTISDIYTMSVMQRKDWKDEEIKKAWEVLLSYKSKIRDVSEFISGIIKNLRKEKTSNYLSNKDEKEESSREKLKWPSEKKQKKTSVDEYKVKNSGAPYIAPGRKIVIDYKQR